MMRKLIILANARIGGRRKWTPEAVDMADRVKTAEEVVVEALAAQPIAAGQSLEITQAQSASLNSALSAARKATTSAEASYGRIQDAVSEGRDCGAIPKFRTPVVDGYRAREAALLSQRTALQSTVNAGHPALVRVETQLLKLNDNLDAEAARADWLAKQAEALTIEADVRALETKAPSQSRNQVEVRQLEREWPDQAMVSPPDRSRRLDRRRHPGRRHEPDPDAAQVPLSLEVLGPGRFSVCGMPASRRNTL